MAFYEVKFLDGTEKTVSANSAKEVKTACKVLGKTVRSIQREPSVHKQGKGVYIRTYKAVK